MRLGKKESGFTILELLSVMSITSFLAAIAIPQYAGYRAGGFDRRAQHDLRAAAMAQEAYFLDNDHYVDCNQSNCSALLPNLGHLSAGVMLDISATTTGFSASAYHAQGTGEIFHWNS